MSYRGTKCDINYRNGLKHTTTNPPTHINSKYPFRGLEKKNNHLYLSVLFWCSHHHNLPYCVLSLQAEEETLGECFNVVNTEEMVLLHTSCQVSC